jgi:hypothetical protein
VTMLYDTRARFFPKWPETTSRQIAVLVPVSIRGSGAKHSAVLWVQQYNKTEAPAHQLAATSPAQPFIWKHSSNAELALARGPVHDSLSHSQKLGAINRWRCAALGTPVTRTGREGTVHDSTHHPDHGKLVSQTSVQCLNRSSKGGNLQSRFIYGKNA